MVLIDTAILSLAFRRRNAGELPPGEIEKVQELKRLALAQQACLIGMVRQEILTGIRSENQFLQLKTVLDGFVHLDTTIKDHDAAAECSNLCRTKGIASSSVDMLLCAMAIRHDYPVLTVDHDFVYYSRYLPFTLYKLA